MKFDPNEPPREFNTGGREGVKIRDCGRITLEPDEQVTFVTESGAEYDVARKSWGFYATPSLNGRLAESGLRAVLVKNPGAKFYIMLVEQGEEDGFAGYLSREGHEVVSWLDGDAHLLELQKALGGRAG